MVKFDRELLVWKAFCQNLMLCHEILLNLFRYSMKSPSFIVHTLSSQKLIELLVTA